MRRPPRFPQGSYSLSPQLYRQLQAYALAATAAGVSLLALKQSSQAEIIFTKTSQVIGKNGIYGLDLNHDGIIDFLIHEWPFNSFTSGSSFSNRLGIRGALGNVVVGSKYLAAALKWGAPIGPTRHFIRGNSSTGVAMAGVSTSSDFGYSTIWGHWANVKNRYLGLRFKINGENHFGWARLTVDAQIPGFSITATLTGYAYETEARKAILAGQKIVGGPTPGAAPGAPAARSLGALAQGSRAASRRKP